MQSVQKVINGVTLEVDYKTELIGLLLTLSDEEKKFPQLFAFNLNNGKYVEKLKEKFGYLESNETVQKFFYLKDKYGLHYHMPIELALSLDDNFDFKDNTNFKYIDNEEIKEFCKELKNLSEEIYFREFYEENRETYLNWLEGRKIVFENHNVQEAIVDYCGEEYQSFKFFVNLISFETNGGYGILLGREAHNCLRVPISPKSDNIFLVENDLVSLSTSIHEFLHSIINPLTEKYKIFTKDTSYIYDKENQLPGYPNDEAMANETIIRAITIRIYHKLAGITDHEKRLVAEEQMGFRYVRLVYEKLLEYESNRNIYLNIDSFYMNIAEEIKKEKK